MSATNHLSITDAIGRVINRLDLTQAEMQSVMRQIMTGQANDAQIGGFLVGLRMKSESIDEIVGAASVMRELSTKVSVKHREHLVDIVGTGGDDANLFNVSSASAYVAAAAGCTVAKHGNRSVSSNSGSADLLEQAGVRLNLSPEQVAQCIDDVGLGFLFAPAHHSAMKHAIGARKALAQRTVFNILGPMTNPAGVTRLVVGVFNRALCRPIADALGQLGAEHVMVVHSEEGLDEISLASNTHVCELKNQQLQEYTISPKGVGLESQTLQGLSVDNATQSLALIKAAFGDNAAGIDDDIVSKAQHMIALNAGAAIYVAGLADTWSAGVSRALDAMQQGLALNKMHALAEQCAQFAKPV